MTGGTGLPNHLDGATDPIVDVERRAGGRETGVVALEFHDQAFRGGAFEP